jgi:hypothetical protein
MRTRARLLSGVLVAVAAVQLGRLGGFMADGERRELSVLPLYDTFVRHSCLSAYYRAAELARGGEEDLYRPELYRGTIGPFHQEIYQYPPPFLLLPRVLGAATGHDFFRLRPLWFGLAVLSVVGGLVAVSRSVRGPARRTVALLAPAVLAAVPTLLAFQYGNFHLAAVALAAVAFLLLRRPGRAGAPVGGALLAFVIWAKLFPGLLLVPLVVERRWRAVGWTAAWGAIWLLVAMVALGPAPLVAFVGHQLGEVVSGSAFPFLAENERVVAANLSVYAVALKVAGLVGGRPPRVLAGWVSAAAAVALVVGVARAAARQRGDDPLASLRLALAALFLGALVSPFAPQPYAGFAGLWLLTLLVPGTPMAGALLLVPAWLALAVMVHALPLRAGPTLLLLSLVGQLVALAPAVGVLWPTRGASEGDR